MTLSNFTDRELWMRLYRMYMVDNIPMEAIADQLGYADQRSINQLRIDLGLPAKTKSHLFNGLAKQMFTPEQDQIILGGILGDGCVMGRDSRNPIYTETHSIHQIEYANWKQSKLYPFVQRINIGHKGVAVYMRSVALPQLRFYRNAFYPAGKKIIPVESLAWFDDLALAVWYMDDGGISKTDKQIKLSTCGFDMRTVGMLQGWLATKWGIMSHITTSNGKYPTIVLLHKSNDRFLSLIEPYIIPSMRYKLGHNI